MEEIQSDKEEKNRRAVMITVIVLLVVFILGYLVLIVDERRALMTHSPEELEEYMEDCIHEDIALRFDIYAYFPGYIMEEYLPYEGKIIYEDGSEMEFPIYWGKKDFSDVRSDYEEDMVKHFTQKYGFSFEDENVWYRIRVKESDVEGENSKLYQFLMALENGGYIEAGQEIPLYLEMEKENDNYIRYMQSVQINISLDEPVDFENIRKELIR